MSDWSGGLNILESMLSPSLVSARGEELETVLFPYRAEYITRSLRKGSA